MKRLKKFWQNNSVLLVLLLILVACLIAISIVVFTYFVGDSSSKYGDRLDGIEDHPFGDAENKELVDIIKQDETVIETTIRSSGKIIYITIKYAPKTSLVEAKSKALATLDNIDSNILEFYDIQYLIEAEPTEDTEGFKLMGSHNVAGTGGIVWNNNTVFLEDEDTGNE